MKGVIVPMGLIASVGIALIFAYVFFGMVTPTVFQPTFMTQNETNTGVAFSVYPSVNNGTFTTVLLNDSVCNGVTAIWTRVYNSTCTTNGACAVNLTRGTNYTMSTGSLSPAGSQATVNMTSYNTTWNRAGAGPISYNNTNFYVDWTCDNPGAGNATGYSTLAATGPLLPVFFAVLLIVVVMAALVMFAKSTGMF